MSLRSFVAPFDKIIIYKIASIGALVMGFIVGYINLDHRLLPANYSGP